MRISKRDRRRAYGTSRRSFVCRPWPGVLGIMEWNWNGMEWDLIGGEVAFHSENRPVLSREGVGGPVLRQSQKKDRKEERNAVPSPLSFPASPSSGRPCSAANLLLLAPLSARVAALIAQSRPAACACPPASNAVLRLRTNAHCMHAAQTLECTTATLQALRASRPRQAGGLLWLAGWRAG